MIAATNKNGFLPYILNRQNAHTGNVAPATGIPSKLLYISFIVLALLKYLIQYTSYKTIKTNAIKSITVQPDISLILKSLNINDKQVTEISPLFQITAVPCFHFSHTYHNLSAYFYSIQYLVASASIKILNLYMKIQNLHSLLYLISKQFTPFYWVSYYRFAFLRCNFSWV